MISVGFRDKEFSVEESVGVKQIHFIVANPISVDTHCTLVALTYQDFDLHYNKDLRTLYPSLESFTLRNKYDQAECKPAITSKYEG